MDGQSTTRICHKCKKPLREDSGIGYLNHQHSNEEPKIWFHRKCFNHYEHYYGLDKPLD